MDHGESIREAIAREMYEEVSLQGGFSYKILAIENPQLLEHNFYQMRLVVELLPEHMTFGTGGDADEVAFKHPDTLKNSAHAAERLVYTYSLLP